MTRRASKPFLTIDLGGGVTILAAVALIAMLGVHPITQLKQEQTARSGHFSLLNDQTDEIVNQIRELRGELRQAAESIENRQLKLMDPDDLNTRIAGVIDRTAAEGLEILAIKPGELTEGEMHGRTPIEIGLTGTLPDLVRYLHEMRRESPDLVIQTLEISSHAEGVGVVAHIRTDWLTRAN